MLWVLDSEHENQANAQRAISHAAHHLELDRLIKNNGTDGALVHVVAVAVRDSDIELRRRKTRWIDRLAVDNRLWEAFLDDARSTNVCAIDRSASS